MSRIQFASIKDQDSSFTFSKKVKMVVPSCAPYYSAYFNRKQNHLLLHLHLYYIVTNFWTQSRKVACLFSSPSVRKTKV